jgi:hypothetical protein
MYRRRQGVCELRQQRLDLVDNGDCVRGRLALDVHDDRWGPVDPRGLANIFDAVHDVRDIRQAHRGAVLVRDDERPIGRAGRQLIVGIDGVGALGTVERALCLIGVGRGDRLRDLRQAEPIRRQRCWIRLHADGRFLAAAHGDQPDAGQL